MKTKHLLAAFLLGLAVNGKAQLTAAVAANMQFAFEDIRTEFRKNTGIEVKAVYGASGKLSTQIRSGAPFDVFVSADVEYPDSLWKHRHAVTAPRTYASGVLVLWTSTDLDLSKGLALVKDPAVKKIGVGDPKVTVYGPAALDALRKTGYLDEATPKVVYGQNISQVGQYVVTGAVDLGFAPLSIAGAPANKGKGKFTAVDPSLYPDLPQAAVVTKFGKDNNPGGSQKLVDFLFTPKAREILARYGYKLP